MQDDLHKSYLVPKNFHELCILEEMEYVQDLNLNFDLNSSVLTAGDMVFLAFSNNTSGGYIRFEWEL